MAFLFMVSDCWKNKDTSTCCRENVSVVLMLITLFYFIHVLKIAVKILALSYGPLRMKYQRSLGQWIVDIGKLICNMIYIAEYAQIILKFIYFSLYISLNGFCMHILVLVCLIEGNHSKSLTITIFVKSKTIVYTLYAS